MSGEIMSIISLPLASDTTHNTRQSVYADFCEEVIAHKCIICKYLSESKQEILRHLRDKHEEDINSSDNVVANETFPEHDITGLSFVLSDDGHGSHGGVGGDNSMVSTGDTRHMVTANTATGSADNSMSVRPSFLCAGCSKCFNSEKLISEHLSSDSSCAASVKRIVTNSSSQPKPSVKVKAEDRSVQHEELDALTRNLKCSVKGCSFYFKSQEQLANHESCHSLGAGYSNAQTDLFKCFKCDKTFQHWKDCCTHIWRVHSIDCGMLVCSVCRSYRTMYHRLLSVHHQTHENKRQFSCEACGKGFNQISQLKNHLVTHLDKNIAEMPTWAKPKHCDICDKMFSDSKSLKKHVQAIHSKLKPYVCNVCNHKSARKSMLQLHMRQHTGDKPYSCSHCDYKTGDPNSLRRHVRRHTNTKPYKCPYCSYAAIQSTTFKSHLKAKHSEQPEVDLKACYQAPVLASVNQSTNDVDDMVIETEEGVILVDIDKDDLKQDHVHINNVEEEGENFVEISMDM